MTAAADFLGELLREGLFIATGVDGLYGTSGLFEEVIEGLGRTISRWGEEEGAEVMRFSPGLNRTHLERSGFLKSFPHLAGTIHSFDGDERDHACLRRRLDEGENWTEQQRPTEVAATPAACYPVYPAVAAQGPLPTEGRLIDVCSYCFRHEPSPDPARLQMFRQREYVRIGTPEQAIAFRGVWLERGGELARALMLPFSVDHASDPFFGRVGKMLAANQREQSLKFELLVPIANAAAPTACVSFNYHQDHFGAAWEIRTAGGEVAHTACVGFGMERLALALFRHHGLDSRTWPQAVRRLIWS